MLIIYAHPNKDGHCGCILQEAQEKLKAQKIHYQVMDLYEMNYDPVLKQEEHYTSGHREVAKETKKIQEIILKEDKILVIYPTWWNAPPAILKGFFDRVLVSHFAFQYDNMIPHGLLKGKKAFVITTTGGPVIFQKIWAGSCSLKTVLRGTLSFCGIKVRGCVIGSSTKLTEGNKRKIVKVVGRGIDWLS